MECVRGGVIRIKLIIHEFRPRLLSTERLNDCQCGNPSTSMPNTMSSPSLSSASIDESIALRAASFFFLVSSLFARTSTTQLFFANISSPTFHGLLNIFGLIFFYNNLIDVVSLYFLPGLGCVHSRMEWFMATGELIDPPPMIFPCDTIMFCL